MSDTLLSDLYSDIKDKYILLLNKNYLLCCYISQLKGKLHRVKEKEKASQCEISNLKEENQKLRNRSLSISEKEDKERILFLQSKIIKYKQTILDLSEK